MEACLLAGADLVEADLRQTPFDQADLSGATLEQANLKNANWWRAKGLNAPLITELKKRYPPSEDADEATKTDYQKWLAEQPLRASPEANEEKSLR